MSLAGGSRRYTRARLAEREWHKFVHHNSDHEFVQSILDDLSGPIMVQNGGSWIIVCLSDPIDRVTYLLRGGWPLEDDRGYGWWAGKRYNCASSNSMHPSR